MRTSGHLHSPSEIFQIDGLREFVGQRFGETTIAWLGYHIGLTQSFSLFFFIGKLEDLEHKLEADIRFCDLPDIL